MDKIMTGAEILLESLLAEGIDTVFGYPGGQILQVYDKMYSYSDRLRHIRCATNRARFTPPRAMPGHLPDWVS